MSHFSSCGHTKLHWQQPGISLINKNFFPIKTQEIFQLVKKRILQTSSGLPSESTVSVYGFFFTRFKSSWRPSNRKAINSCASCCAYPENCDALWATRFCNKKIHIKEQTDIHNPSLLSFYKTSYPHLFQNLFGINLPSASKESTSSVCLTTELSTKQQMK